jgi:hypothetical protein
LRSILWSMPPLGGLRIALPELLEQVVAAGDRLWAGVQNQDFEAGFGDLLGSPAAAGAGADDDGVVNFGRHWRRVYYNLNHLPAASDY